jgi:hypothetical protein
MKKSESILSNKSLTNKSLTNSISNKSLTNSISNKSLTNSIINNDMILPLLGVAITLYSTNSCCDRAKYL